MRAKRVALVAAFLCLALSSRASGEVIVGAPGNGAGEMLQPRGVAVDESTDLLYVADRGNNRVDVFDADTHAFLRAFGWGVADGSSELQTCTTTCLPGVAGAGAGQFNGLTGIAVDNGPVSGSLGAVYVADSKNARVQKFSAGGAFLWMVGGGVNDTTGGNFCSVGSGDTCGAGSSGSGEEEFNLNLLEEIGGIDVGPEGVLYVGDQLGESSGRKSRVQKYAEDGSYLNPPLVLEVSGGAGRTLGIAVTTSGDFYVATSDSTGAVRRYDSAGVCLNCASPINPSFNISAIAADADEHLFIGELSVTPRGTYSVIREFDSTEEQIRAFYGLLENAVRGIAPYSDGTSRLYTSESDRVLLMDFPPPGPVVPISLKGILADPVNSSNATLHSLVNPEGASTTFHFEYVDQAGFETGGWSSPGVQKSPESPLTGSDFELHDAVQKVTGLLSETEYHFRVVATNPAGAATGVEATFVTEPPLAFGDTWSSSVGIARAVLSAEVNPQGFPAVGYFEYVDEDGYQQSGFATAQKTPAGAPLDLGSEEEFQVASSQATGLAPDTVYHFRLKAEDHCKADFSIVCTFEGPEKVLRTLQPTQFTCPEGSNPFRIGAAMLLGDCRGYEMVSPVDKNGVNVEPVFNVTGFPANFDESAVDGEKVTYSAYRAFASPKGSPYSSQYLSRRTGDGWQVASISPPREGPTFYNTAGLDFQFKAFTEDLCYGWFLQDVPGPLLAPGAISDYPNLYRRDNCDPDGGSYEAITTGSPTGPQSDFFPVVQGFSLDGSRTFFDVKDKLTADALSGQSQSYEAIEEQLDLVCVLPSESVTTCGIGGPGGERFGKAFHAVSDDGQRVYWSGGPSNSLYIRSAGKSVLAASGPIQFRGAASDGARAIYLTGPASDELFEYDLESGDHHLIAEDVQGVVGTSEDASIVYFVSTQSLAPGAVAGSPNLYRSEGGAKKLVATLGLLDLGQLLSPMADSPIYRTSRVTPDGERLVFMSKTSLTGYDNVDAVSGVPDSEVFLYDATADGGEGEVLCVSCNPSLSRPVGRLAKIADSSTPAAGWIPTWPTQLYPSRVVSDDGKRVFFNSFDALVARDKNEMQDVYQWEAPGSGDCEGGGYAYVQSAGGCVGLVSSGESPQASEFVDASASGGDVFFKTTESLVPQDPGLLDIYDARVEGGLPSPPPPAPEPSCEDEECMGPAGSEPGQPTPQSLTFVGPGNVVEKGTKPKKCPKGKHKARRKGKVVCVKKKKRHVNKSRRAGK